MRICVHAQAYTQKNNIKGLIGKVTYTDEMVLRVIPLHNGVLSSCVPVEMPIPISHPFAFSMMAL